MPHEKEIMAFFAYSDQFLHLPKPNKKEYFEEISSKKAAINELINWICDSPEYPVSDILMEFAMYMECAYESKHLKRFKYSASAALELYDYFYAS